MFGGRVLGEPCDGHCTLIGEDEEEDGCGCSLCHPARSPRTMRVSSRLPSYVRLLDAWRGGARACPSVGR